MRDWLTELQGALGCVRAAGRSEIGPDRWPWVWPLRSWRHWEERLMECGSKGQAEDGAGEQRGGAEVSTANAESVKAPRSFHATHCPFRPSFLTLIVCVITRVYI